MQIVWMQAQKFSGLRIVSSRSFEGFQNDLAFGLVDGIMEERWLVTFRQIPFQQAFGEIFCQQHFRRTQHNRALNGVFQFADVAGPVVANQDSPSLR